MKLDIFLSTFVSNFLWGQAKNRIFWEYLKMVISQSCHFLLESSKIFSHLYDDNLVLLLEANLKKSAYPLKKLDPQECTLNLLPVVTVYISLPGPAIGNF